MDISARAVLLADRPRMGHLGHQCSHAPVRPILHLVSSSRRPRRETGCRGVMSSIAPYLYAVPLFVPEARSFVPASACAGAPRARGRQGWPTHSSTTTRSMWFMSGLADHSAVRSVVHRTTLAVTLHRDATIPCPWRPLPAE